MHTFLDIAFSFPTLIFTVLLLVALGYWLLSLLGVLESDVLDLGDGGDVGAVGGLSGLLLRFGLDGLPLALIFTGICAFAWLLSFFADYLLLRQLEPGGLRLALGLVAVLVLFVVAMPLAGWVLQPLRPLFANHAGPDAEAFLGREAVVRSARVGPSQGEVDLDDGGAGLILKVRSEAEEFVRGDKVLLVEYLPDANVYRVIRA